MSAAERYWNKNKNKYPHKIEVKHMSAEDIDPARFSKLTRGHFLRVPFNGSSYWGFADQATMELFKKIAGVEFKS